MNKITKTMLCALLAGTLAVSFTACGGNSQSESSDSAKESSSEAVLKAPVVVGESVGYYFAAAPADITFNMRTNGASFENLKVNGTTLTRNQEYRFNVGTEVLTINQTYLSTLTSGTYAFTFSTSGGTCDVSVTVGDSSITENCKMQFAKTENNATADHFYANGTRDNEKVSFDFVSFGDFTTEGTALEFVNIFIDKAPLDNTGINWRLGEEDLNIRLYSDGTVIYRNNFTGTEMKNGVSNGMDNIWWKINRTTPNYLTDGFEKVNISRENGITTFSLDLTYSFLGINATDDFRFLLEEASDASSFDFNLYESGIMIINEVPLADPAKLGAWPMFTHENTILRPEEIVDTNVPADYTLSFARSADKFYSKVSYDGAAGATFDFWTKGDFGTDGSALEFVQIYLDMPALNTPFSGNWKFNSEDILVRIYSDGTVYKLTNFNGQADNIWLKRNGDSFSRGEFSPTATKLSTVINKANGITTFSVTFTAEQLGLANDAESFRYYLAECSDNSENDFNYYGSDLMNGEVAVGDGAD